MPEILQELVEGFASFQVVEESPNRDPGAAENQRTAKDIGITVNHG